MTKDARFVNNVYRVCDQVRQPKVPSYCGLLLTYVMLYVGYDNATSVFIQWILTTSTSSNQTTNKGEVFRESNLTIRML